MFKRCAFLFLRLFGARRSSCVALKGWGELERVSCGETTTSRKRMTSLDQQDVFGLSAFFFPRTNQSPKDSGKTRLNLSKSMDSVSPSQWRKHGLLFHDSQVCWAILAYSHHEKIARILPISTNPSSKPNWFHPSIYEVLIRLSFCQGFLESCFRVFSISSSGRV